MKTVLRSLPLRWRIAVVVAVAAVALVVGVLIVQAEPVPRTFAYQGVLTDAAGIPLTGDHSITMRVYVDGSTATPLCTEVEVVTVTNGLFRMVVGDGGCSVDPAWFALTAPVYLGITVDTTTLTPRVPLFPVASAYQAEHAESADRLIVRHGSEVISVGGMYCGSSLAVTGSAGGYVGAKTLCETACGDPAAHLCSAEEVVRSLQVGIDVPTAERYAAGIQYSSGASSSYECFGWRDGTVSALVAPSITYHTGYGGLGPSTTDCGTSRPFLCCL
jgi:hypothetical protein